MPAQQYGSKLLVDFSPKGGSKDVIAECSVLGIRFPDGNFWSKL